MKTFILILFILFSCENSNESKNKDEHIEVNIENLSSIKKLEFLNKDKMSIESQPFQDLGIPYVQIKVTFDDDSHTLLNKEDIIRLTPKVSWFLNEQELYINNSFDYLDQSKFRLELQKNDYELKFVMSKDELILEATAQLSIEEYPIRNSLNFEIHEFPNSGGKVSYSNFTSPENGRNNAYSILRLYSDGKFKKVKIKSDDRAYDSFYYYAGFTYYGSNNSTNLLIANYSQNNNYEIDKYKGTDISITNIYAYSENILLGLSNGEIWKFDQVSKVFTEVFDDAKLTGKIVKLLLTSEGLIRATTKGFEIFHDKDGWKKSKNFDDLTTIDHTNSYRTGISAVGTKNDGLYILENDVTSRYTKENHGLSSNSIVKIDYFNNGRFYFATENALYFIEEKNIYRLDGSDQFNSISDFYINSSICYIAFEGGIAKSTNLSYTLVSSN